MSAIEVAELLAAWELRLRNLGAECVGHFRQGLTRTEVEALADSAGVRFNDDAAAVWMWHDGDRDRYADRPGTASIVPSGSFISLRGSLERSAWLLALTGDGADDPWSAVLDEDLYYRRSYVTFIDRESPTYLDCAGDAQATSTGISWATTPRAPRD